MAKVVVVTHRPPATSEPGVTYVDDFAKALALAKEAAGDQYVTVIGATIAKQCIEAGELDEVLLLYAPVMLGDGTRLFEHPGGLTVRLDRTSVTETPLATHLWFKGRELRFRAVVSRCSVRRIRRGIVSHALQIGGGRVHHGADLDGASDGPRIRQQLCQLDRPLATLHVDQVIAVDRRARFPIGHANGQLWMGEHPAADQFAGVGRDPFEAVAARARFALTLQDQEEFHRLTPLTHTTESRARF